MSIGLAVAAASIATVTLAGYATGSVHLVRSNPDWQAMSISTALLCLGLPACLAADVLKQYRLTRVLDAVNVAFSGAMVIGIALSGSDPSTRLTFRDRWFVVEREDVDRYQVADLYALSPFRTMSLQTAVALFLLDLGFRVSNRQGGVSALVPNRCLTGRTTRRRLGFLVVPPRLHAPAWDAGRPHGVRAREWRS